LIVDRPNRDRDCVRCQLLQGGRSGRFCPSDFWV
jgi:hypothetical protein